MSESPPIIQKLKQRSHLASGGRFFAGLFLLALGVLTFLAEINPPWMHWTLFGLATGGLFALVFWRTHDAPDREETEEDLIEIAQRAIRNEAGRLDSKRQELETVLMAYGELMEFPDYQELRHIHWKDETHVNFDKRVADLIASESDAMLERFSSGKYWETGKFEGRGLLLDLVAFMESIARVYQPDSEMPLLELNLESLFKAVNRVSLQIILLLEELPVLEVKGMNLRKASENIRKASKMYKKYEELQPYLKPVRYLWQGSKMLLTSNPLLAAGWIASSELIWKGGKHLGKKAMDAYLLSLVRQTLGIVAWETAGIYDSTHRYRNPDWIYGVEIAHLLSRFDCTQVVLREAFSELGRLPLRSTYDRIFLYRCIAQNASPKPEHFAQPELLGVEIRTELHTRLVNFYEKNISASIEANNKETVAWREGLSKRLAL